MTFKYIDSYTTEQHARIASLGVSINKHHHWNKEFIYIGIQIKQLHHEWDGKATI